MNGRSIGWLLASATGLALGASVVGCKSEPPRYPTPTTTTPDNGQKQTPPTSEADPIEAPDQPLATKESAQVAPTEVPTEVASPPSDALICPGGTVLLGLAPPSGVEQWCAKEPGIVSSPKQGPIRRWWPGGQKQSEGQYDNGAMSGEWTWWFQNGQASKQGMFVAGNKHGTWLHWSMDGTKVGEAIFLNGKMTEQWVWTKDKSGKMKETHTVMEGFSERMGTHDAPPIEQPPADGAAPAVPPAAATVPTAAPTPAVAPAPEAK